MERRPGWIDPVPEPQNTRPIPSPLERFGTVRIKKQKPQRGLTKVEAQAVRRNYLRLTTGLVKS